MGEVWITKSHHSHCYEYRSSLSTTIKRFPSAVTDWSLDRQPIVYWARNFRKCSKLKWSLTTSTYGSEYAVIYCNWKTNPITKYLLACVCPCAGDSGEMSIRYPMGTLIPLRCNAGGLGVKVHMLSAILTNTAPWMCQMVILADLPHPSLWATLSTFDGKWSMVHTIKRGWLCFEPPRPHTHYTGPCAIITRHREVCEWSKPAVFRSKTVSPFSRAGNFVPPYKTKKHYHSQCVYVCVHVHTHVWL